MVIRYAENSIVARYDKRATEFMREVVKWERQAERAASPESKKKYQRKAQEVRKKALDALESAKIAAGRRVNAFQKPRA
jgi:hypothetical protein